jgi:hypothetical protein
MTAGSRLARLEGALPPTAAVCLWLEEAHSCGSFGAYLASVAGAPGPAKFFDRIREQVRADARRSRGRQKEAPEGAARAAVHEALFRVLLVMDINQSTVIDLTQMVVAHDLVVAHAPLILELDILRSGTATSAAPASTSRELLILLLRNHIISVLATAETCTILEGRYLGGHPVLFPDVRSWLDLQIAELERLVDYAILVAAELPAAARRSARLTDSALGMPSLRRAGRIRASALVAARLESVRIETMRREGKLDEAGRRAAGTFERVSRPA